jgi:hypothetical protein
MDNRHREPVDPAKAHSEILDALQVAWRRYVGFVPVLLYYFVYWRARNAMRRWAKRGALGVLSVTLCMFIIEILMKFFGEHALAEAKRAHPNLERVLLGLFVLAGLVILYHNTLEARGKHGESALSEGLWRLLIATEARSVADLHRAALPVLLSVFKQYKCCAVCFWRCDGDRLMLVQQDWHPGQIPKGATCELPIGEGIAGLVYSDRKPRYVPRLYFPFNRPSMQKLSVFFPHALVFEIRSTNGGIVDVEARNLSLNAVLFSGAPTPQEAPSFVAVPVAASADGHIHGVLCINFQGTNTLDTISVKLASALGVVLAEKLDTKAGRG